MTREVPEDVAEAERLVDVFGCWPSFHDAEVLRFSIDRAGYRDTHGPTVECVVHVFEMTSEVGPKGYYILKNHSLVTFRFLEVDALELSDFNHQNALWALEIVNIAARQMERVKFAVTFASSWGMGAAFQCFGVEVVDVQPCDQEGNATQGASDPDADVWDAQIEAAAATGKFDALAQEALNEHRAGLSREV